MSATITWLKGGPYKLFGQDLASGSIVIPALQLQMGRDKMPPYDVSYVDLMVMLDQRDATLTIAGTAYTSTVGVEAAVDSLEAATAAVLASTASGNGLSTIGLQDAAGRIAGTNGETGLVEVAGRVLAPVADSAAVAAITALARANGGIVVKLDDYSPWVFESGSSAGADAWHIVPGAGTGRWVRPWPSLADLAAVTGGSLVGSNASGYVAATVTAQLAEVKAIADAGMTAQKKTLTFADTDFDALGAGVKTTTLNIGTALPANARIVGNEVRLATPFTGGGATSCTADIGSAGDADAVVDGSDIFAAAVDGEASTKPAGISPNKMFAGSTQLLATITSDVDLKDLTAGGATVDVLYIVLP